MSPEMTGRVVVERYELIESLGSGPVGVMWRAHDHRTNRDVAIREVAMPDVLDEAEQAVLAEKVIRDARAAARLDHPCVVTVYDVVEEHQRPFVVTELVTEPTLEEIVARKGPLPPTGAARVGLDVLAALEAAHAEGLVHRDVRPSNVLISETGGARLGDFGVSSVIDDPKVTTSGGASPSYFAPEHTGTAGATPAADLWSLGATLYFAVEGVPPFDEGEPVATLEAIVSRPPRPAQRAGSLGLTLDGLLVKDPIERADQHIARRLLGAAAVSGGSGGEPATPLEAPVSAAAAPSTVPQTAPPPTAPVTPSEPPPAPIDGVPPEGLAGSHHAESDQDLLDPELLEPELREPWFFGMPVETVPPPPLPPRPPPPPPLEPEGARRRSRFPKGLALALLAFLVLAVMVALVITGGRFRSSRPTLGAPVSPGPVSSWLTYTDATTGFTIRYPPTWSVRRSGSVTDFRDPSTGAYLRVDHQQPPASSPEGAWYDLERNVSGKSPNYNRIQITPTTFQGFRAAIWEFTYSTGALEVHALDLGLLTSRYGFSLDFQTRAGDWKRLQPAFDAFKDAFRPPT